MNYIELVITFDHYHPEHQDIFIAELAEMDFESFVDDQAALKAYIAAPLYRKENIDALQAQYPDIPFRYTINNIENINWNEEWEKNFEPIIINESCMIRAPFHKPIGDIPYEIVIEPKMSFGTGHHATTSLMIEFLLETDCTQKNVLDMGCGTGVLGILARMRHARHVDLVDNDDWAFLNTAENCGRNDITGYDVFKGGVDAVPGDKPYQIILANINRNILLDQMPYYAKWLDTNGTLFLSGILKDDMDMMLAEASKYQLELTGQKAKQNWLALAFSK